MIQVNAVGDACPLPVIKVRKALEQMTSGELEVLVDNDVAVQNIERFAKSRNCAFSYGGEETARIQSESSSLMTLQRKTYMRKKTSYGSIPLVPPRM